MKALVLAGGVPQIALLENLKQRGITTILCDYYENPVARTYADIFYRVSTLDVDGIMDVAKREQVDFLITVCTDQALLTVARVSETLGLPCYIDYQTALNVTNKFYMKEVFVNNAIPTAKHVVQAELDTNKLSDMRYPLVVKPVDCNSSKGVIRVENEEELRTAFKISSGLSRTSTAVIEEFIDGLELSVDAFVENGKAYVLSISELEKVSDKNKFVIFRTKCPARIEEKIQNQITEIAQKIADTFALKNSPMLIQMISDGKQIFVLEFSARTGGGEKFKLIRKVTGFDVVNAVVDLTLGVAPHVSVFSMPAYYATEFIYCRPGVFDKLVGFEELKKQGIIFEYFQFKGSGTWFDSVSNSGDRVAGFVICADSEEELSQKHKIAINKIKVLDIDGRDMVRYDILQAAF